MARNIQATRRWLAASSALIVAAAAMIRLSADADAHGSFGGNRHAFDFARSAHGGALQGFPLQPVVGGPGGGREVFAHTPPFQPSWNEHGLGSHVATLGFDGVWVDTYLDAPPAPVEYQPTGYQTAGYKGLARNRAPSIKTPDRARSGVILVRGDSKGYVLFP